jgi:hypothetical protein
MMQLRRSLLAFLFLALLSACSSNNNPPIPPQGPPGGPQGGQCTPGAATGWPGTQGLVAACAQQGNDPTACNCMARTFTNCISWQVYQQQWQSPGLNQLANQMLNDCLAHPQGGQFPGR